MHHLARNFGRWPWELLDEPADAVMHALAIEEADALGMRDARKHAEWEQEVVARRGR